MAARVTSSQTKQHPRRAYGDSCGEARVVLRECRSRGPPALRVHEILTRRTIVQALRLDPTSAVIEDRRRKAWRARSGCTARLKAPCRRPLKELSAHGFLRHQTKVDGKGTLIWT